jgi:hypothetical protein
MAKVKLNIEIEAEAYENLKKQYLDFKSRMGDVLPFSDVDGYIANFVEGYASMPRDISNLKEKFKSVGDLFDKFDDIGVDPFDVFGKGEKKATTPKEKETKN